MERAFLHLRLYPGTEATFDRRHDPPPREVGQAFAAAGLRNVSAFRRGTDVWIYAETDAEVGAALDLFGANQSYRRWQASLVDVVAGGWDGPVPTRYQEVFHSDGPPLAPPFERAAFVLVVHPDRIAEYDERHAKPWPEMLQALGDAGFRNYSGFRYGALVAYYGEFHPDLATALATIGATDTNRRWGESFQGIITTLTDEAGNLFTAREIFHLA